MTYRALLVALTNTCTVSVCNVNNDISLGLVINRTVGWYVKCAKIKQETHSVRQPFTQTLDEFTPRVKLSKRLN